MGIKMSGIRAYSGRVAVGAAIPRLQVNSDRMDHFLTTDGSDEHNQAPGQVRGRATEGWPEGRIETLGQVEKDCRKAAPKEERVGKTCESNEWERTSQNTPIFTKDGFVRHGARHAVCSGGILQNARSIYYANDSWAGRRGYFLADHGPGAVGEELTTDFSDGHG